MPPMQDATATFLEPLIAPPRIVSRSSRAATATRVLRSQQPLRSLIDTRLVRAEMTRMRASSTARRPPGSR